MSQKLFERVTRIGWLLASASGTAAFFFMGTRWAAAVLVGFAWIYLNFYFLMRLMDLAMAPQALAGKRIAVLASLKFPVIYLTGFFILKERFFPMGGILAGLTVFFVALVAAHLAGFRLKTLESRAS